MKGAAQSFPTAWSARASAFVCPLPHAVRHPAQQGSRLAWHDSLFDQVEQVLREAPEMPAVGEAFDSSWDELEEVQGGDEAVWRVVT